MSIDNQKLSAVDETALSYADMLASGDPDLVEYAKLMMGDESATSEESADEYDATQGVDDDEQDTELDDESEDEPEAEAEKPAFVHGVRDKSGKHFLPYAELESARRKAADTKAQLDSVTEQFEKLKRQTELAAKKGIELPPLAEDEEFTDEMLAEIEEISPEFGVLARKVKLMMGKNNQAQQKVVQAEEYISESRKHSQEEIDAAYAANYELQAIMQDPVLSIKAIEIEERLSNDPRFASLEARYLETVKRVRGAGNEGQNSLSKTSASNRIPGTPQSMSDISSSANVKGKTTKEVLSEMPEHELSESMQGMTTAQLEALLS